MSDIPVIDHAADLLEKQTSRRRFLRDSGVAALVAGVATACKTDTTPASAPETSPDADEPSTKDSTETIAESSEMPLKNRSTVEKPRQTVAAEPAKSTSETEQRTVPAFNARNTAAEQPVTHPVKPAFERPRAVRPAFERQAASRRSSLEFRPRATGAGPNVN